LAACLLPLSIDGMVATSGLVLLRWAGPGVRVVAGQGRACAGRNRNSGRKHGQLGPVFAEYLPGVTVGSGIAIGGRRGRVNRPPAGKPSPPAGREA
jgi:hypothetical protein